MSSQKVLNNLLSWFIDNQNNLENVHSVQDFNSENNELVFTITAKLKSNK